MHIVALILAVLFLVSFFWIVLKVGYNNYRKKINRTQSICFFCSPLVCGILATAYFGKFTVDMFWGEPWADWLSTILVGGLFCWMYFKAYIWKNPNPGSMRKFGDEGYTYK